jgi:RNA polymerase sigma factor (sigma-70 family)
MAKAASSPILQQIRRLREDHRVRGSTDQELLRHLGGDAGEAAFHALVGRHGPMVLGVCRDVLGNEADAEDAFQATFLVLARKAGSVRKGASLSCWLHGVAYRTALKARAEFARRRKHEGRVPPPAAPEADELSWREVRQVLHEEVHRLAERYRAPLVLCYLEGKTQDEAAAALGLAKGTLKGHLERGRALLRQRLVRRGLGPASALAAAVWPAPTTAAVPALLADCTARAACAIASGKAATAVVPTHVAAVMEGVMKNMVVHKATGLMWALSAAVLVGVGGAVVIPGAGGRLPMTMAADGPAQPPPPKPEALVKQLGSDEFAEREAAGKKLRSLGLAALPAIRAGMKDPDLEIRRRCEELLPRVYADSWAPFVEQFQADKDGKKDFNQPVWQRFKAIAGDSRQSRKIFAEMIEDPARVRALQGAATDPEAAGAVYAEEMARQLAERERKYREMVITWTPILLPKQGEKPPPPHRGDFATVLFLGCYPAKAGAAPKSEVETRYVDEGIMVTSSAFEGPMRKLYAGWAANRTDHESIRFALRTALRVESEGCLAVARRVAADAKLPSPIRASAFPVLAQFGGRADMALIEPLRDDTTVYGQEIGDDSGPPSEKPAPKPPPRIAQVRDMAVTMMLVIHGKEPSALGFDYGLASPDAYFNWQYYVIAGGFRNDTDRAAAHRKAKAWLDARPKADAPPTGAEIEELVKQLGSAKYIEREAADRNLRTLGKAARPAVEAGMKSPQPEVARRCARLFDQIGREQLRRDGPP